MKEEKQTNQQTEKRLAANNNNNTVHLSCAHQHPERSYDTY